MNLIDYNYLIAMQLHLKLQNKFFVIDFNYNYDVEVKSRISVISILLLKRTKYLSSECRMCIANSCATFMTTQESHGTSGLLNNYALVSCVESDSNFFGIQLPGTVLGACGFQPNRSKKISPGN